MNIIYKGEDVELVFSAQVDISGYTKEVTCFTTFSAPKTATIAAVDNYKFKATFSDTDTADLVPGRMNLVLKMTDAQGKVAISKAVDFILADPQTDGIARSNSGNNEITIVFNSDLDLKIETGAEFIINIMSQKILDATEATNNANAAADEAEQINQEVSEAEALRVTAENNRIANEAYRNKYVRAGEYDKRVTADGGSIRDRGLLNAMFDDALNLLPNTDLWYNFECGIKTRVSGLNTYVTKVYDLSTNNRDATQATEAFQPYLVGNINPANRYAIWGRERYFPFSQPIIKSGSDQWSLSITANRLSTNSPVTSSHTDSAIYFFPTYIYFVNKFGAVSILNHPIQNAISRYYLVAKNGMLQFYLNGKLLGSSEINTAIDITNIYSKDAVIYDFRIFNKALNKSEIEFLDAKMSAFYPQFEGVEIGNQVWEASSAMDTIAPDGTIIPEVTDNAAWSELTTPAWCYYNNSEANGAVFGRIYNGYAVQKLTGSPIWRAPMSADYDQLSTFLGGYAVVGGKLKAEGLTFWDSPNTGATNESGFAAIAGGGRTANGVYQASASRLHLSTLDANVANLYGYAISSTGTDIMVSGYYEVYTIAGGQYLRRLRRVPPGDLVREISSGTFKDNITYGTFKDIPIPNAYRVIALKVTASTNLTNVTAEVRTSAGVLVQSILSDEAINAADTPVIINILSRQKLQLQDYVIRITAVGNGGDGMEVITIIEKAII